MFLFSRVCMMNGRALVDEHRTEIIKCNWNLVLRSFYGVFAQDGAQPAPSILFTSVTNNDFDSFTICGILLHLLKSTMHQVWLHVVGGWWSLNIADDKY